MFNASNFGKGHPAHNAPGTHGLGIDAFHEQITAAFCSTPPTLGRGTPLTTLLGHTGHGQMESRRRKWHEPAPTTADRMRAPRSQRS